MICLGIDPDTKNTGLALVEVPVPSLARIAPPRVLRVAVASAKGAKVQDRLREMAERLDAAALYMLTGHHNGMPFSQAPFVSWVAIEWQKLRPRGERNPNSIVDLNGVAGMCLQACFCRMRPPNTVAPYLTPTPSEWKGQVPKDIHQARVLAKVGLTEDLEGVPGAETMTKTQKGHVIDAIGLALWASRQRVRKAG